MTVGTIVGLVAAGRSEAEVLRLYPYLEAEDIREALAYAAWRVEEAEVGADRLDRRPIRPRLDLTSSWHRPSRRSRLAHRSAARTPIHYHLYYRLVDPPRRVEVLALWHASRGSGPEASKVG